MTIRLSCPHCNSTLKGPDDLAGQTLKCPKCGKPVEVPASPAPVTPPPSPAPPPAPESRESERVPCPMCSELIMANAKVCRFCGHWLVESAAEGPLSEAASVPRPAGGSVWLDAPAIIGFILALLSAPMGAFLFFVVFGMSRLMQSLIIGTCVAFAAVVLGIVGIVLSGRRRSGARALGFFAVGIGALVLMSGVTSTLLMRFLAAQVEQVAGPSAIGSAASQILGTKPSVTVRMKCGACGDEFELSSTDLIRQQAQQGLGALGEMYGGDVNKALDRVEKEGTGFVCPKCKKRKAQVMMKCPECGKHFLPPRMVLPGEKVKCPHCGKDVPVNPMGFLDFGASVGGGAK